MKKLYAKSGPEWTPLPLHLMQVGMAAKMFANYLGLEEMLANNGALLHDIGKVQPIFQSRLLSKSNNGDVFRHEIASLFFLSAFSPEQWHPLIKMVVGHHKSVKKDFGGKGLLDLEENDEYIDFHLGNWEEWIVDAIQILNDLGINCKPISKDEAIQNLNYCIDFCEKEVKTRGYSKWRGLLMGADHFASALIDKTEEQIRRIFKTPDLSFYNRQHPLFP